MLPKIRGGGAALEMKIAVSVTDTEIFKELVQLLYEITGMVDEELKEHIIARIDSILAQTEKG